MNASHTNLVEALRDQLARVAPGDEPRIDLDDIWAAAGKPQGRSPRQWRRSTLGRVAIAHFAGRRAVGPEAIFVDTGGPRAHVLADVAVALVYMIALDPGAGVAELDDILRSCPVIDPEDISAIEELMAAEARRKADREVRSEPYREDARFWRELEARSAWKEAYHLAFAKHRTAGAGPEEARRAAVAAADELERSGGDEPGRTGRPASPPGRSAPP